jgi:hypothetical protein
VQDFGIARLRAQHLPAYFLGLIGQTLPAMLLCQRKDLSSGHELSGPQRARSKRSQGPAIEFVRLHRLYSARSVIKP